MLKIDLQNNKTHNYKSGQIISNDYQSPQMLCLINKMNSDYKKGHFRESLYA